MSVPSLSLVAIRQPALIYGADGRVAEANDLAEALADGSLVGSSLAEMIEIFDPRRQDGTHLSAAELPEARVLAGKQAMDLPLLITARDGRTVRIQIQ